MLVRYEENTKGRDFIFSDPHGEHAKVYIALKAVKFDPAVDRLFCAADLVDRGPDSYRCAKMTTKPWFHAVRGNHEEMCLMGFYNPDALLPNRAINVKNWHTSHGGGWFYDLKQDKREQVVEWFKALPYAMEIQTRNGLVGVVHADILVDSWADLVAALTVPNHPDRSRRMAEIVWGDDRFRNNIDKPVADVHAVYVGHRPTRELLTLGNVHYIDGGACYGPRRTVRLVQIQ